MFSNSNFNYDIVPTFPTNTSGEVYNLETKSLSRDNNPRYERALVYWFLKEDGSLAGKFEEVPGYFLATYLEYSESNRGTVLKAFKDGLNTWYPQVTSQKFQVWYNGDENQYFNLYNGVFTNGDQNYFSLVLYQSSKETNFDGTSAIKVGRDDEENDIGQILHRFNFIYKNLP